MLTAKDVMTTPVISVSSDSTVSDVARLLVENRISGVPVIDGDDLVGIVTEGDLVHRSEIGTTPRPRSWWLNLFRDTGELAAEYTKSHSTKVADIMTPSVATVSENTPLADVADLLERKRVKRVPVTRAGKVVGIVSRANLIRALAATSSKSSGDLEIRDDKEIERELLATLRAAPWSSTANFNVTVTDGVAALWGRVDSEDERRASRVLAENIKGVRRVEDHRVILGYPITSV